MHGENNIKFSIGLEKYGFELYYTEAVKIFKYYMQEVYCVPCGEVPWGM
jgi:hypothetical protein